MSDNLEFNVSQYVDGTLPPGEISALEARLVSDPLAHAMVADYQRVEDGLRGLAAAPLPDLNWSLLAEHISQTVAMEAVGLQSADRPAGVMGVPRMRLVESFIEALRGGWSSPRVLIPRLAVAASILIAVSLGIHLSQKSQVTDSNNHALISHGNISHGSGITVQGPLIETASAALVVEISISGPALAEGQTNGGGEGVLDRTSQLVVAANDAALQDMHEQLPY